MTNQNAIQIFENEKFGNVRVIEIDGQPYFVGADVANALGYRDTFAALKQHVDDEDKQNWQSTSFASPRGMIVINESGVYSLILRSNLPKAKEFKRWFIGTVLPSIHEQVAIDQQSVAVVDNSSDLANIVTVQGVRGYIDENGTAWLNVEDVAHGLGFVHVEEKVSPTRGRKTYESIRWERINGYLAEFDYPSVKAGDYISENIFYLLAMKANNEVAKKFQLKIANEILPSIRKHGLYINPNAPIDPDLLIKFGQQLKEAYAQRDQLQAQVVEQAEKIEAQSAQLADQAPKVLYYDIVLNCKEAVPVSVIAKDYGMSAVRFNKLLHDLGVQYNDAGNTYETKANAITEVTVSGQKLTFTKGNGSSVTLNTQDTNTTYKVASSSNITINGTLIPSIASGTTNKYLSSNGTWQIPPNDNNKVAQNISTVNSTYPILLASSANATANIDTNTVWFGSGVKVNPSTSNITATSFTGSLVGNADSATKATKDGSDNVITTTYLTKTDASNTYLDKTANAASATKLSSDKNITVQDNSGTNTISSGTYGSSDITIKLPNTIKAGNFTGNVTGNVSGSSGSCTGLAAKATGDKNGLQIDTNYAKLSADNTFSGKIILSKNTDASGSAAGNCALQIGDTAGSHLEFDGNEIMAKSNVSTPSALYINNDGGTTYFGNGGISVKGGGVTLVSGGLTASNQTITAGTFSGSLSGNALTSSSLQTARALQVSLNKTSSTDFRGNAAVTNIGVQGTLQPAQGGTGQTVLSAVAVGAATKATQDGSGNTITSTYAKLAGANFTGNVTVQGKASVDNLLYVGSDAAPNEIVLGGGGAIGRLWTKDSFSGLRLGQPHSTASNGYDVIVNGGQNLLLGSGEAISKLYNSTIGGYSYNSTLSSSIAGGSGENIYLLCTTNTFSGLGIMSADSAEGKSDGSKHCNTLLQANGTLVVSGGEYGLSYLRRSGTDKQYDHGDRGLGSDYLVLGSDHQIYVNTNAGNLDSDGNGIKTFYFGQSGNFGVCDGTVITSSPIGVESGGTGKTSLNDVTVGKANTLTTARALQVLLNSTGAPTFNGTADVKTIGVTGVLPVANGDTGSSVFGGSWYADANCTTDAATANKVISCPGFVLRRGAIVGFYLETANTANTASNPKLVVNGTSAKYLYKAHTKVNTTAMVAGFYVAILLELCGNPEYIKFDKESNSFIPVFDSDDATGIIVNGQKYSIPDFCETEVYEGAPTAEIQYVGEGSKFLFNAHVKAVQSEQDIITVEDAIIDLNGTTQEDLDDLRGAIFDLANQIANNQE